jgi:hypothetical protein
MAAGIAHRLVLEQLLNAAKIDDRLIDNAFAALQTSQIRHRDTCRSAAARRPTQSTSALVCAKTAHPMSRHQLNLLSSLTLRRFGIRICRDPAPAYVHRFLIVSSGK